MKTKNIFILFALLAIVFSLAACSSGPKISNFYMAKDDQGTNKTTTFAPTDALILFFDVNGVRNGTPFEARWYVLNAAGKDPNTPFKIMDQNYSSSSTLVISVVCLFDSIVSRPCFDALRFHLTNTGNWPVGQYRVDVYMSGNKVGEVLFSVAQ
jgi:hypothetical protein